MTLAQMQQFQAVCQCGSIGKAAKNLFISQPSISNSIRNLENELDVQLFIRDKNRLILTNEGTIFYNKICDILASVDSLSTEIRQSQPLIPLHFGISYLAEAILGSSLFNSLHLVTKEFNVETIKNETNHILNQLNNEELDLALVVIDPILLNRFYHQTLSELSLMLYIGKDSINRLPKRTECKPIILFDDYYLSDWTTAQLKQNGIHYQQYFKTNQISVVKQSLQQRSFCALLPQTLVTSEDNLYALPAKFPQLVLSLVWKKEFFSNIDAYTFVKYFV